MSGVEDPRFPKTAHDFVSKHTQASHKGGLCLAERGSKPVLFAQAVTGPGSVNFAARSQVHVELKPSRCIALTMAANVFQFVGVHRDFVREDDFEQKHLPIVRNLRKTSVMKNLGGRAV